MTIALGVDPGFANLGLAVVELLPAKERVLRLAVFETEKSAKKLDVRASSDNFRRSREIAKHVRAVILDNDVGVICAEAMSFARNAGAAHKVGLSWGVLASLCEVMGVPLVQASPQAIKRVLCGRKDASKEDVQLALRRRYTEVPDLLDPLRKGDLEHAADALGAVVGCLDAEVVQMARRAGGRT